MTGKAGAPLTEAMFYVLMALRRGELCGTEIAAWTERCTEGRVRLGPGTLYTILGRFLEEGFIQETSVQGRQRNYRLTEKGQRAYRNERLRLRLCLAWREIVLLLVDGELRLAHPLRGGILLLLLFLLHLFRCL